MEKGFIKNLGLLGLVKDYPGWDTPSNAFDTANNVRSQGNKIGNINCGRTEWYSSVGNPPLNIIYCPTRGSSGFWVAAKNDKISTFNGDDLSTGHNVTYWTSTIMTGVPVWCTFVEAPLYWPDIDILIPLSKLPWDSTHDWDDIDGANTQYRAAVIRRHKNQLIAIDIAEGTASVDLISDRLPRMVHWSEFADEGLPPPDWKYADPTSNSGRKDLSETAGQAIDGLSLGEIFIVYKTDSAYRFTPVNNENVYDIKRIKKATGIMSRNCVAEFQGLHYVMADGDIYVTDGFSYESLLDNRIRDLFLSLIDDTKTDYNYVIVNRLYKEVWFCIATPDMTSNYPDKALVWSVVNKCFVTKDIPNVVCMATGPKDVSSDILINNDNTIIDNSTRLINKIDNLPSDLRLFGGVYDNSITEFDTGPDNDGVAIESNLVLKFFQIDDEFQYNTIDRGYPHFSWLSGNSNVKIRIGTHHSTQQKTPNYKSWKNFDIKTQRHLGLRSTGAYHTLEILVDTIIGWSITGISFDYENSGER